MFGPAFMVVDSGVAIHKLSKIVLVLALLCMAFFIKEPLIVKSQVYRVFREISKAQLMWQTRDWNKLEGPHFVVRYQDVDYSTADMVLGLAEESYEPVSRKFGFSMPGKMPIIIYPTKESLGSSFGWSADESAMGVYWAGVIRVLSPDAWIEEKDPRIVREIFGTEGPVAHELTHLLIDYATCGNYTRWFTEGIAQYEEVNLTGFQIDHRDITSPEQLIPLSEMDREFDRLSDQNLAYFQSFQAINYLVSQYGEANLQEILLSLRRGRSLDESFRLNLGVSLEQFEDNFRRWAVANL